MSPHIQLTPSSRAWKDSARGAQAPRGTEQAALSLLRVHRHLPGVTCSDHGSVRVGTQHPLVVELTLVIHVVLELPQRLRGFQQLPVLVVREVVLDEQGGMGQEVELIVAGAEGKLVSSRMGCSGPALWRGRRGLPGGSAGPALG